MFPILIEREREREHKQVVIHKIKLGAYAKMCMVSVLISVPVALEPVTGENPSLPWGTRQM